MPTVSVIIPTYNRAAFLAMAIRSVVAQTYTDVEVIVVDDGSSDDTSAVAKRFDGKQVRYVYQSNSGRSVARNRGMEAAHGDYLALLDDDDFYLPNKLANQVAFLEKNTTFELVASGFQTVDKQDEVLDVWLFSSTESEVTLLDFLCRPRLLTSTVLFHREVLKRLDHYFDPKVEPAEDIDFWVRILNAGCRMAWLPGIVSAYRLHGGSYSSIVGYNRSTRKLLDKLFAYSNIASDVHAEKKRIYARHHLHAACRAFGCGQVTSAQFNLLRAVMIDSEVVENDMSDVVGGYARRVSRASPAKYIDFVFEHFPVPIAHLKRCWEETLNLTS